MKKLFIQVVRIFVAGIVFFCLFLLFFTIREYKPEAKKDLPHSDAYDVLTDTVLYSVLSWNIGYAGLGCEMDFFYDGGNQVRDSKRRVLQNFEAISNFLSSIDTVDFMLLQEIDLNSKRSYGLNQFETLEGILPHYFGNIALNYKVDFVPVPVFNPLGRIESGIVNFTAFKSLQVTRYDYAGDFVWPKRLFMAKRCFLVNRYKLYSQKELLIINTHNSAFDDGSLRIRQLRDLGEFAQKEYRKGNYVVMGGDWNQSPVNFIPEYDQPFDTIDFTCLPDSFLTAWNTSYTPDYPTNRRTNMPYRAGETLTTVIDYFISSPNIEVHEIRLIDLGFQYSDHQPVYLTFKLKF